MRILCLFLIAAAYAQTQPRDNTAVDAIFADLNQTESPGCAVGVFLDGNLIYAKGYGLANIEQHVPIRSSTVFDIGSLSKQFTAASILLLKKAGRLRLDDDIRKFLPELPDLGKITVLNLLNHTSGVRDYLAIFSMAGIPIDSVTDDYTALALLSRQKSLNFSPGSAYLYSNSGYFLLSLIVQRASGKNLKDFAQESIFGPLGMIQTQYRNDHRALIPNRALAYSPVGSGYRLDVSYYEELGDGGVHTSVEDLMKWDENFYTAQLGGKQFLAEMQERGKLNNGEMLDYAKGLTVGQYRGLPIVEHGGSWGGYRSHLVRFPEQRLSVACLCNVGNANPRPRAMRTAEVFLENHMGPKPAEPKPAAGALATTADAAPIGVEKLAAFKGDYSSDELSAVYRLEVIDGNLTRTAILDQGGIPRTTSRAPLRPTGDDRFTLSGMTLRFSRTAGVPSGFTADAGRTKGIVFVRVKP